MSDHNLHNITICTTATCPPLEEGYHADHKYPLDDDSSLVIDDSQRLLIQPLVQHSAETDPVINQLLRNFDTFCPSYLIDLINTFGITDYHDAIMFFNTFNSFKRFKIYHLKAIRLDTHGILFVFHDHYCKRFRTFLATDVHLRFTCIAPTHYIREVSNQPFAPSTFTCDLTHASETNPQCCLQH